MPPPLPIQPKHRAHYDDPRQEAGFEAAFYPTEAPEARLAPAGVDDLKAMFKAVYARRNACVRAMSGLKISSPDRARLIDQTLALTEAIDHLEDICAPIGFIAEPVMDDDMFARELRFTHAPVPTPGESPGVSSFSLYIPIALENELEQEDQNAA